MRRAGQGRQSTRGDALLKKRGHSSPPPPLVPSGSRQRLPTLGCLSPGGHTGPGDTACLSSVGALLGPGASSSTRRDPGPPAVRGGVGGLAALLPVTSLRAASGARPGPACCSHRLAPALPSRLRGAAAEHRHPPTNPLPSSVWVVCLPLPSPRAPREVAAGLSPAYRVASRGPDLWLGLWSQAASTGWSSSQKGWGAYPPVRSLGSHWLEHCVQRVVKRQGRAVADWPRLPGAPRGVAARLPSSELQDLVSSEVRQLSPLAG